jgi:F-type H+-transporting ATPase subunit delta
MKAALASYRYARALNEYVENDQHVEVVLNSLKTVLDFVETNEPVKTTLNNPAITREIREQALRTFLGKLELASEAVSFVILLFKRRRLTMLPYIVEQFSTLVDERLQRITAHVQTATPLSDDDQGRIKKSLETYTNESVTLNIEEAPELLGGVVARFGTTIIDGSLQTRLERLKKALLAEEIA